MILANLLSICHVITAASQHACWMLLCEHYVSMVIEVSCYIVQFGEHQCVKDASRLANEVLGMRANVCAVYSTHPVLLRQTVRVV